MVAWKWGPALAAGCTIVMKPAEQTPLTCLRMARLAQEGRHSGWRDQRRARLRPDRRRCDRQASGRRQDRVHRRTGDGEDHSARSRRNDEAAHVRAGRQESERHLRRCRSGCGRRWRTLRPVLQPRPVLLCRQPVVRRGKGHDEVVDRLAEKNKDRKVGDPFDPETQQGPQVDQGAVRQDPEVHRVRQEGRREDASPAASASATRATSSSRRCSPA